LLCGECIYCRQRFFTLACQAKMFDPRILARPKFLHAAAVGERFDQPANGRFFEQQLFAKVFRFQAIRRPYLNDRMNRRRR